MDGIKFDFSYFYGVYGCESLAQINIISDLQSLQKAYEEIKVEKLESEIGTTNEIVD
jgi:hypothetical protein